MLREDKLIERIIVEYCMEHKEMHYNEETYNGKEFNKKRYNEKIHNEKIYYHNKNTDLVAAKTETACQHQILIIDDDGDILDLLEIHLVSEGFRVQKAYSVWEGLHLLETYDFKLIIMDLVMPGMDAPSMCKIIREESAIPIILLSANSKVMDKIAGLGAGADDYITKPFDPLELIARVKAQLRRYIKLNQSANVERTSQVIALGHLIIDKGTHKVKINGRDIKLTPIEFDILYLLASNAGKVFSTEDIFEKVWNEKVFEVNNTVMVHIRRIREKLEIDPRKTGIIKTVWGVGYKIEEVS
jgi:two-component system, OmpR family, response regulator VanR